MDTCNQLDQEKFDILESLYHKMCNNHVGAHNAIVTSDLAGWYNVHCRTIRLAMRDILKRKRCPVISYEGTETKEGYQGWFIAATEREKDLYIQTLRKKIKPLQRKMLMIDIVFQQYYETENDKESYNDRKNDKA